MGSKYDVNAIRQKLKQTQGKFKDEDEFKPGKAESATEAKKYRFYILPPLLKGDVLKSGEVKESMEQFFISHANHWVNDKPYPCPRVWTPSEECPICQFGFDLLKEEANKSDDDKRRAVIRQWMPTQYNMVNIFFTSWKGNPEELRGKVKFFNASKTLFDQWAAALMKEDSGDPEDPQAYGVFFDENAGFVYELQVLKQGRQNSYKTSKFLPNNGNPTPMIKNADGSANEKMLPKLLRNRHNLWDKIEIPDPAKIATIYSVMSQGDDDDEGGGFDKDESEQPEQAEPKAEPKAKKQKKQKPPKEEDEDVATLLEDDSTGPDLADDDNSLADEAPLVDEVEDVKEVEEVKDDKPAAKADGDVDSEEIDDLLSQLEDDD